MIREELKKGYLAEGGLQENLTNDSHTIQGMLKAKNSLGVNSISNVGVEAEDGDTVVFGHTVSDLQSNVAVKGGKITGTLKYVSTGSLVDTWGEGHFIVLKFVDTVDPTTIKVGLDPSESSGLVPLDSDFNGAFKITNKYAQNFVVVKTVDNVDHVQTFALNELMLEPKAEA